VELINNTVNNLVPHQVSSSMHLVIIYPYVHTHLKKIWVYIVSMKKNC